MRLFPLTEKVRCQPEHCTSPVRIPLATMDDALAINYGHHCKCLCWSTGVTRNNFIPPPPPLFFGGVLISLSQIIVNQRVQVLADNSGQMAELASAWKVQTAISRLGN